MHRIISLLVAIIFIFTFVLPTHTAYAGSADFDIPNGHFYMQAVAPGTPPGLGHSIFDGGTDTSGQTIMFWTAFNKLGGVAALGYPSSERFMLDGFWTQATQRVLMQWRPELKMVVFVNVFDKLHDLGQDAQLLQSKQVPVQVNDNGGYTGWDGIRNYRLSWLNANPAIKNFYFSSAADPVTMYGLPTSQVDTSNGAFDIIRLQRIVIQHWKVNVPGIATPGMITVGLGGDIAKTTGLVPANVGLPIPPPLGNTPVALPQPGQILFGSEYHNSAYGLAIINPKPSFRAGEQIAYAAYLRENIGSPMLQLNILYTAPNGQTESTSNSVLDAKPQTIQIANRITGSQTASLAVGTYRLQFVQGNGGVLAEGTFTISGP